MKEQHPIDELFQERLEKHKTQPSDKVWEQITSEINPESRGFGGWFALRAASVSLLIGLSGWLYFYTPVFSDPTPNNKSQEQVRDNQNKQGNAEPTATEIQEEKEKRPVETIEIIRPVKVNKNSRYLVSNQLPVADEEDLETDFPLFADTRLDVDEIDQEMEKSKKIKIRLKYNTASTTGRLYAEEKNGEIPEPEFTERLLAYAGTQLNNIVNGEPVELPKTKGKPQLELNLNLGKLFNK